MPVKALALALVVLAVGGASAGSAGSAACHSVALVSLRSGKVLKQLTHRLEEGVRGADAVPDGRGGWYVAGVGVAHVISDARKDPSWRPRLSTRRQVFGLTRAGGRLFVTDGYRVFAVSERTGRQLWVSARIHNRPQIGVLAVAATASMVFVGGYLTEVGSQRRNALAALDARNGRLLPWRHPPLVNYRGSPAVVAQLAVGAGRLYLGGGFIRVGGARRLGGVAAVTIRDGKPTPFAPYAYNRSSLVAAGRLVLIGGPEGGGVFDGATGKRVLRETPLDRASAITVRGTIAYFGGDFRTTVGGDNLLAIDLRTGKLRTWFPRLANEVSVSVLALSGDKLFVGGAFCSSLGG
jgi:outer membrane protein assembly factor BamB